MNQKKALMPLYLFPVLAVVGCGGGGGSGSKDKDVLDKIVNQLNALEGSYKSSRIFLDGDSNKKPSSDCWNFGSYTREELQSAVSSTFENGACFDDDSYCFHVDGSGLLETQSTARLVTVSFSGLGYAETAASWLPSGIYAEAGTISGENCQASPKPIVPVINGVYEGYAYYIDQGGDTFVGGQGIIRSDKVTLDCSGSICYPRDQNVIRDIGGIDFSPTTNELGDYIAETIYVPTSIPVKNNDGVFNFWGTASEDGSIITGQLFPQSSETSFTDCWSGECLTLAFRKMSE